MTRLGDVFLSNSSGVEGVELAEVGA